MSPRPPSSRPVVAAPLLLLLCGLAPACGGPEDAGAVLVPPAPDRAALVEEVQPFLGPRCATRDCHGDPARNLLLHAVGYHRLRPDGAGVPLDELRLTGAEVRANYEALRLRMVDVDSADETLLLRKVAPPGTARRIGHGTGIVVFKRDADPDWKALVRWVEGAFP